MSGNAVRLHRRRRPQEQHRIIGGAKALSPSVAAGCGTT